MKTEKKSYAKKPKGGNSKKKKSTSKLSKAMSEHLGWHRAGGARKAL